MSELLIPHRDTRPFVHAADIFVSGIEYLKENFPEAEIFPIVCYFRERLGSSVHVAVESSLQPESSRRTTIQFKDHSSTKHLVFRNPGGAIRLSNTYKFDSEKAAAATVIDGHKVSFKGTDIQPMALILDAIKKAAAIWPKKLSDAYVVSIEITQPIEISELSALLLIVHSRTTFAITEVMLENQKIGEIRHVFVESL